MQATWLTKAVALVSVVLGVSLLGVADLPEGGRAWPYITIHLLLTLMMLLGWKACRDFPGQAPLLWLVLSGAALRVILIPVAPFTTHDVQRYLWDGAVLAAGVDPYRVAPGAPEVAALQEKWLTPAEHVDIPTLYPPLAIGLFALVSLAGPEAAPWVWQTVVALASLVMLVVGWVLLAGLGLERHIALLALSPLVLLEGGVGAHLDVLVGAFLAGTLWLFLRDRWAFAGVFLGGATLLKLWPVLAIWPLFWIGRPKVRWYLILGWCITMVTGYGVAVGFGLSPIGSLPFFLQHWSFGSPSGALLASLPTFWRFAAMGVLGAAGACMAAMGARRGRLGESLFLMLSLPFLLGPVVFPWYLVPLVLPLAMAPSYFGVAWVSLLPLTYEVIDEFDRSGIWQPARWPLWVVAAGWIVGLAWDAYRVRTARSL